MYKKNFPRYNNRKTERIFIMNNEKKIYEKFSSAASASDCTGLIPAGDNLDPDTVSNYKDILPYSAPGAIKDLTKAEFDRIKRLNGAED